MAEATAVYNLNTTRTRRVVEIDGTKYSIRDVDELSMAQAYRLQAATKDMVEFASGKADASVADRASSGLANAIPIIFIDLPEDVASRISDAQRAKILELFFTAPAKAGEPTAA